MQVPLQRKRTLLIATALAVGLPHAVTARAQSTTEASNGSDIIVTARRTEERLQDVPISITVFNQQQLDNRNIVSAQDLATYTPSLSVDSNFGSANATFSIRGFNQDIGTAPTVGVYFADVVAPRGGSIALPSGDGAGPGNFFDLQNVQVLKGPQGTLQGRNTTGGAVMLVPQKPTDKFEGYVEASLGSYDLRRIQAVLNVPLSDTVRARFGIDSNQRNGYLNNRSGVGPSNFSDINYIAIRGSLVADITPNLENYTIVSYTHSRTNGDVQKLIAAGDPTSLLGGLAAAQLTADRGFGFYDVTSSLPYSSVLSRQWQIINTTTWQESDDLTIKNIASYAQLREDLNTSLFGTDFYTPAAYNAVAPGTGNVPVNFAVLTADPGLHTTNEATFTEELHFQGRGFGNRLNWQAGVYFEKATPIGGYSGNLSDVLGSCTNLAAFQCSDPIGEFYSAILGFPYAIGANDVALAKQTSQDVGIYSQATYDLTDQLKLTGGFRYTWDRQHAYTDQQSYDFSAPNTPLPPVCTFGGTVCTAYYQNESSAPTWLIDLDYKPVRDVLGYIKYARGYRTGNIKADAPPQFVDTKPEKLDSYEAGIKTEFHGAVSGTFNVAGFYNKFSNQQVDLGLDATPGTGAQPTTVPYNIGKSRIYGVEIEGNIRPFSGMTISGGYTYLNTRITAISSPTIPYPYFVGPQPFNVGDPLTLSPKNKFTITGTYALPVSPKIGRMAVSATFTHADSQLTTYGDRGVTAYLPSASGLVTSNADLGLLPATNLVNLNANWEAVLDSRLDLSVFVTNVTGAKYYTYVAGLLGNGFETAEIGAPRMFGARAKVHF